MGSVRLVVAVLILGLLAAAPSPSPAPLGDGSADWQGVMHPEGGDPLFVKLHLNMVSPPFVSGVLYMRPFSILDCPACLQCPGWAGAVTGQFKDGGYVLTIKFPTKELLTCDITCMSTIDVVLDFEADGSMSGTGYFHECLPIFSDWTSTWRLLPPPP